MNLDTSSFWGIIQTLLIALFTWIGGVLLGGLFLFRLVRDWRARKSRVNQFTLRIFLRFWAWMGIIVASGSAGVLLVQWTPRLASWPILVYPFAVLFALSLATIYRWLSAFPQPEWMLCFVIACPGLAFEVIRRELQGTDESSEA